MARPVTFASFALAALLAPAARAEVTVVDPAGGYGVDLLHAALAAAAPGDVLLLQPGDYLNLLFPPYNVHVGITLLPAPGAGRLTLGPIDISGVPLGQQVVLRGLDVLEGRELYQPALYMHASAGTLWLEDCSVTGFDGSTTPGFYAGFFAAGIELSGSQGVFRHCTIRGGHGIDAADSEDHFTASGSDGLRLTLGAKAMLHDCTVIGGDAGDGESKFASGDYAGHGVYLHSSDVTLAACSVQGGAEGALNDDLPGTGGSALYAWLAASDARVLDCTFTAGAVQGKGTAAAVVWDPQAGVLVLDEPARTLVLPDQVREGETGLLQVDGEPGDLALVLASPQADLKPLKGQEGTLVTQLGLMQGPFVLATLTGPDGHLEIPF